MDSSTIEWLIFDLGGVLIEVAHPEQTAARLAEAGRTDLATVHGALRESFAERPFSLAERFQAGEIGETTFLDALDRSLQRPLGRKALRGHLRDMLRGEIAGTAALLAELAPRIATACYSNTNPVHWRHARAQYPFFAHFRDCMASHEVGLAKPDARVFDYVQQRLGAGPAGCLLIDDRERNVAAARAAGWQAVRFESAHRLADQLASLGVK